MKDGVLIFPLDTVQTAPRFFSTLSLMLRACGFEVIVLNHHGPDERGEKTARQCAMMQIPFHGFDIAPRDITDELERERWKLKRVNSIAGDYHKIIWVDLDFSDWRAESPLGSIVTLNWTKLLSAGEAKQEVGLC